MSHTTIGILAGMGPRSTSPFLELLLDECQQQYGAKYDIDYPHIVIYSLPTPFYIDRLTDEDALKDSIKVGMEKLQNMDVDFIGVPCNSAHKYFDYITEGIKIPVLNIIQETLSEVEKGSKISLFATEMTNKSGLYQDGIKDAGCEYIFDEEWQELINQIIISVKNKEKMDAIVSMWNELANRVRLTGVEKIIIACTELNAVAERSRLNIEYIDSSKALAKGLIRKYIEIMKAM